MLNIPQLEGDRGVQPLVCLTSQLHEQTASSVKGEGGGKRAPPEAGERLQGSWEKASLINESHPCLCLATKLKIAALGQFSQESPLPRSPTSEGSLFSEAASTNLTQEGPWGMSLSILLI